MYAFDFIDVALGFVIGLSIGIAIFAIVDAIASTSRRLGDHTDDAE